MGPVIGRDLPALACVSWGCILLGTLLWLVAVALVCIALLWIAFALLWARNALDSIAWIALLGLHLDWDCIARNCIAWTCVALNVLQLHLFAWQSWNGCRCWANQSLRNGVCSRSIGGALGMVVGLLGLCGFGAKSELVA